MGKPELKKIVFMGEKPLGYRCLRYLHEMNLGDIVAICTGKERTVWWGTQQVRRFAHENKIPIIKRGEIPRLGVDVIISVLYPFVIEREIIESARLCAVNFHQAPLPEYRGCNSVSHAIINGEKKFGASLHLLEEGLDTGDIIDKRYIPIGEDDTAKELYMKVDELCFQIFVSNIADVVSGVFTASPQDMSLPSKTYPRTSLSNKKVDLGWDRRQIWNFVRGMEFHPFEPAYIEIEEDKKLYLLTKPENRTRTDGENE